MIVPVDFRPEDEPLMVRFHESLSEESVYLRYFHMAQLSTRVAHERLIRKCFIDYDREVALGVELTDAHTRNTCVTAVAGYRARHQRKKRK